MSCFFGGGVKSEKVEYESSKLIRKNSSEFLSHPLLHFSKIWVRLHNVTLLFCQKMIKLSNRIIQISCVAGIHYAVISFHFIFQCNCRFLRQKASSSESLCMAQTGRVFAVMRSLHTSRPTQLSVAFCFVSVGLCFHVCPQWAFPFRCSAALNGAHDTVTPYLGSFQTQQQRRWHEGTICWGNREKSCQLVTSSRMQARRVFALN